MSVKKAKGFLAKIKQGEPVNYPHFISWINSLSLPYEVEAHDISAKKNKGDSYFVEIVSSRLMNDIEKLSLIDADSRASLATQNRSHSQKVKGSMLIFRRGAEHPQTVVFDSEEKHFCPSLFLGEYKNSPCLIIENQQNFLFIEDTLTTLNNDTKFAFEANSFSIYASGKAITNSLHKSFLEQFSVIYLFLDLDLGGLEIAASLKKMLPGKELIFVITSKTKKLLENVISTKPSSYLKKVEAIRYKNPFLSQPTSLILKHLKVIEQEAYLND